MKKLTMGILAVLLVASIVLGAVFIKSINVDATVNEALSSTKVSESLSGFPAEVKIVSIDVNNAGSMPLNAEFSWLEDQNPSGVIYTTSMPQTILLNSGDNQVNVTYTFDPATPIGTFNGTITIQRTA